jgi:cold shock CspA family protein
MILTGTVKFVHAKGYGFVKTGEGDVFVHLSDYLRPEILKLPFGDPMINYLSVPIKVEDISVGEKLVMEVMEGDKGMSAVSWCKFDEGEAAETEFRSYTLYRLISRRVASSQAYGDTTRHCWVVDQRLVEEEAFRGYEYQFRDQFVGQYQIQEFKGVWVDCPCPFGRYNGGPLFDLPVDWKRTVKANQ